MELINFNKTYNLRLSESTSISKIEAIIKETLSSYFNSTISTVQLALVRNGQQLFALNFNCSTSFDDFSYTADSLLANAMTNDIVVLSIHTN